MTNEAKERAIRWLAEEVRSLRLAPTVNGCKPDNWAEQLEVMETCLELVRGCNQVANKSQFGCDPLKMEQLREMDGQKVLLYRMKSTEPLEPGTVKQNGDVIGDAGMLAYHELYLETWVAFTYPPANINMEAWVSVEEKLPDAEEEVRLCCMTASGYRYQCQGFYVPPGTHRDDSGYSWDWECCEEYDEERDDYLVNPGWYESIHNWDEYSACGIVDRVIYWIPLLETPGELEKRLRG